MSWPFGASWWAFTFPLVTLAAATSRYARLHPAALWNGVLWVVLAVTLFFIVVAGVKTFDAYFKGRLLAAPAPAAKPAA